MFTGYWRIADEVTNIEEVCIDPPIEKALIVNGSILYSSLFLVGYSSWTKVDSSAIECP